MPDASQDSGSVLVIDDNIVTRRLLQLHLSALGYRSTIAENGEVGLELAQREPPDAVLLDIQMPGIDGVEVCRRLRSSERTRALPILIVTALSDTDARVAAFEAGADDYVTKPFEARELGARLRAHVTLAQQRGRLAAMAGVFNTLRMLTHEFNNPLQTVVGGLQMTADLDADAEQHAEGLRMAREGAEEIRQLAQQLHTLVEPVFKASPLGPMLDIEASARRSESGGGS